MTRILLDENMPLDFGSYLPGYEVDHLETIGLKGTQNGQLLALARSEYDILLTLDRGILHQHKHFGSLIILVIRVPNSNSDTVRARAIEVIDLLLNARSGDLIELPMP